MRIITVAVDSEHVNTHAGNKSTHSGNIILKSDVPQHRCKQTINRKKGKCWKPSKRTYETIGRKFPAWQPLRIECNNSEWENKALKIQPDLAMDRFPFSVSITKLTSQSAEIRVL